MAGLQARLDAFDSRPPLELRKFDGVFSSPEQAHNTFRELLSLSVGLCDVVDEGDSRALLDRPTGKALQEHIFRHCAAADVPEPALREWWSTEKRRRTSSL